MHRNCILSNKRNPYYNPIRVNTRLVPRLVVVWSKKLDMRWYEQMTLPRASPDDSRLAHGSPWSIWPMVCPCMSQTGLRRDSYGLERAVRASPAGPRSNPVAIPVKSRTLPRRAIGPGILGWPAQIPARLAIWVRPSALKGQISGTQRAVDIRGLALLSATKSKIESLPVLRCLSVCL